MNDISRVSAADTVAKSFLVAVRERGDNPAIRKKDLGIWKTTSWAEWLEISRNIAYALRAADFKSGDVASILSNTVPEWIYADMGVLLAGGVSSGIYPTDTDKQVEYLINDSGTTILFVEDEEQLDKILTCRTRCPQLRKIVIFDMEGLADFSDPMCVSLDAFIHAGGEYRKGREDEFDAMVDSRGPDDLVMLVYTSGTTGPPKGAMHNNSSVMHQLKYSGAVYQTFKGDSRLLFLPLCHVAERFGGYYSSISLDAIMHFAESPETVFENLREIQPHGFFAVPRVWEKMYSSIIIALKDATKLEQFAYKVAIGTGYKIADERLAGRTPSFMLRAVNYLGYIAALRNIRRLLGLDRARIMLTGAAPISPDLIRWYLALGLNMYEVYGQTENCGVATMMPADHIKLGTVGKGVPWGEVKISPQGEILLRGKYNFAGYLNQPDKTAETLDRDGWLHTGDVGHIDNEGFVKITDRMKDIIITAGGKNVTPSEIENQLKFSPYISDAVVIGDKRPFLTALIMIDQENVEKFAQDKSVPFTNYASLCRTQEVQDLIWNEVERVNEGFARVETIKRVHLIDQQLTAEDEEMTPTMKLKRSFVNKKYASEIDAMYRDKAAA